MFFFPYTFWNANCEVPQDTHLYGTSNKAYVKFKEFFLEIGKELERRFGGGRLNYVIPPEGAPIDRDKIETVQRMRQHGVPTPKPVQHSTLQEVLEQITPESGVVLKCRYGAEGKGITVLRYNEWLTNYKVEDFKLSNHGVYGKWPFVEITGKRELLEQLLQHEVIVEKEIIPPDVFGRKKFDLRFYVVGQRTPHFFARLNDPREIVTNFSQGGTVMHNPDTGLDQIAIKNASALALRAARSMNLQFLGVDIMFDGNMDTPLVVELQAFTDFPKIEKFDLAQYIISDNGELFAD